MGVKERVVFGERIDEDIGEKDGVGMVEGVVEGLNVESLRKVYKEWGGRG